MLIETSTPVAFRESVCIYQQRNAAGLHVSHIMCAHTAGVRFALGVKIRYATVDGFLIAV